MMLVVMNLGSEYLEHVSLPGCGRFYLDGIFYIGQKVETATKERS